MFVAVSVLVGVLVGVGVGVLVWVAVAVRVGVLVSVLVGVAVFVRVLVGVGVFVGVGAPTQPGNLKDAIRVLQLKVPELFRYSDVYQNVQSSTGSTLIAL